MIRTLLCLGALVLGGCATPNFNPATNVPLLPGSPADMGAPFDIVEENAVALAFSGGGLRAAAFSHGVLEALSTLATPQGDLLDDVTFITSVSGGSLTAAYFGLNGREGLARYREEVLLRDFEGDMRLSALLPWNLTRILGGGLNVRENFGDALDQRVFRGATFADLYRRRKPDIRIQATDLYHRVALPFIPRVFANMCSDLARYAVADAVAASMAVPLVFAPVVLRTYPGHCDPPSLPGLARIRADPDAPRIAKAMEAAMRHYRDPKAAPYLKLVDGGLSDNYGVSTIVLSRLILGTAHAPMTARDAVRVRRMLFVIVDASRGPGGDWAHEEAGPSGLDVAVSATDAAIDAAARLSADAFIRMTVEWQQAMIDFRCALDPEKVQALGGPARWNCSDVRFTLAFVSMDQLPEPARSLVEAIPTRLTLSPEQVDAAVKAGRAAALAHPRVREYLDTRVTATAP